MKKEAMNLKVSKRGYRESFGGKKRKSGRCNYNNKR